MTAILRRFAWTGACLLGWSQVHASCLVGVPHPTIHVGSASDPKCNYTSIQAAINSVSTSATCPPNIVIANKPDNAAWNEALTITDRSLALIGNADTCTVNIGGAVPDAPSATAATTPQAIISGAGLNAPVITVTGNSNVTVQSLEITGGSGDSSGDATSGEGGGILFNGNGSLTLNATTVDNNQAGYGGGIDVSPSGNATLNLQANTLILNNQASTSGGGIRIEGNTSLVAVSDQTLVGFNTATSGYGGGIEILGPAYANIGSPGYGSLGVISNNSATYGGGIAAVANNDNNNYVTVQLFTTVADRPVSVEDNIATVAGGGLYLKPKDDVLSESAAVVCLFDFRVDGNRAPEGAAMSLDFDTSVTAAYLSGVASINYPYDPEVCGPQPPSAFNAIPCSAGTSCNEFSGNLAEDAQGNPSGGVIFQGTNGYFKGLRFKMQDNNAAYAMHFLGGNRAYTTTFYIKSCLITDNQFSQDVFFGDGDMFDGEFSSCTMTRDAIGAGNVINIGTNATLTLHDDIFDEVGKVTLDQPGDTALSANYIVSNDLSTLPTSPTIIQYDDFSGDPLFVDAPNGNYHLAAYTQNNLLHAARAIDFAPTVGGDPAYDLDGKSYGQDVPAVPDLYGTRDLGAYEAQPINDRIFADGFGDRVSLVR